MRTSVDNTSQRTLLSALFGLACAAQLLGQQPPETLPYFLSGQAFDSHGIDNINLFNGDTGLTIPLGPSYPLGPTGFQYQLALHNSVKFWHFSLGLCSGQSVQFAWIAGDPTVGVGWTLQPGYVVKRSPPGITPFWQYYDPSGGVTQVDLSAAPYSAVTTDGSFLRISAIPNSTNPTSYTVEFPDGTIETFDHMYSAPTSSPTQPDFSNADFGESSGTRFGLGNIKDRFGNLLVTVNWSPSPNLSEPASITLNPFGSTISFTWTSLSVNGFTWRVIDHLVFPAPGSKQLKVLFSYTGSTPFSRNTFDLSGTTGCASPAQVSAPELASVTLSDNVGSSILPFSYAFTYYPSPQSGHVIQKQGAVKVSTLPSLGTITYDYCITAGHSCDVGVGQCNPAGATTHCNPNASPEGDGGSPPVPGPNCPPQGCPPPAEIFTDSSPGIATRTEHDPFTNRDAVTTYDREQFRGHDDQGVYSDQLVFRRTSVISPGNDDGSGSATYARRHYFKVDSSDRRTLARRRESRSIGAMREAIPPRRRFAR